MLVILLILCNSWFEPVIFLLNIGIAVAVNLGTNIVFPSISEYTASIVGIMQLVLSMDYSIGLISNIECSIILMHTNNSTSDLLSWMNIFHRLIQ